MLLRLGAMSVVVVSSPRAAEAVLRTHDHVFASRPHSLVAEIVLYGLSDVHRAARRLLTTGEEAHHHAPSQREEGAVVPPRPRRRGTR